MCELRHTSRLSKKCIEREKAARFTRIYTSRRQPVRSICRRRSLPQRSRGVLRAELKFSIDLRHRAFPCCAGHPLRDPNWLLGGGFCRSRCWLGYPYWIGNRLRNIDRFRAGLMGTNHAGLRSCAFIESSKEGAKVVNRPEAHAIDGAPARSSVTLREAESPVPNRRTARRYERLIRALILDSDSRTPALAGKF
jgi:hypothetical protein